ncbi:universal stress protein [Streptomyces sp. NPDC054783]
MTQPEEQTSAEEAELLVLGSRGLTGFTGLLVGSVAPGVVAKATCPVVLVRAGEEAGDEHVPDDNGSPSTRTGYLDVVLGIGLADPCDEVIEFAFEAARLRRARLRVVRAWQPPSAIGLGPGDIALVDEPRRAEEWRGYLSAVLHMWRDKYPRTKDDAILVNSSRGGLVDTDALLETPRAGRLSGVGLDVYEEEAGVFFLDKSPEVMTDERLARLMTFSNVLVTSHQAYFTRDAVGQIAQTTAANVEDYFAGRSGDNVLVGPDTA